MPGYAVASHVALQLTNVLSDGGDSVGSLPLCCDSLAAQPGLQADYTYFTIPIMTSERSISDEMFQIVLRRAVELDEQGKSRLSERRAREIAIELGVSPQAWEEAFADYLQAQAHPPANTRPPTLSAARHWGLGLASAAFGLAVAGAHSVGLPAMAPWVGPVGLAIATLGLFRSNVRRRTHARLQIDLLAVWLPFLPGVAIRSEWFFRNVLGLTLVGWLTTAIVGGIVLRMVEKRPHRDDRPLHSPAA